MLWIEQLARIVAESHFCRILVHPRSSRITLVGRREDIAVAEYMFITLQRSLGKIAKTAAYQYLLECQRQKIHAGYGFRESFTEAFLRRLRDRFLELRRGHQASMELMRIKRSDKAVEEWIKENVTKKAGALSANTRFHAEGVRRGRAAADQVNLKSQAISQQGVGKKELS